MIKVSLLKKILAFPSIVLNEALNFIIYCLGGYA